MSEPEAGTRHDELDDELDDPGRDPKGLNPPRNIFGAGPDQDSGSGQPPDRGNVGPADKPGEPTGDGEIETEGFDEG